MPDVVLNADSAMYMKECHKEQPRHYVKLIYPTQCQKRILFNIYALDTHFDTSTTDSF